MKNGMGFSLRIFNPALVADHELEVLDRVYELWKRVWVETRREVDSSLPTPSDNFSRQDEIFALFDGDRPIGTVCHRYVDLRSSFALDDSFFSGSIWPAHVLAKLPSLGRTCALGSHIFVDRAYRKGASGLPIKNLLCGLSFARMNVTKPDLFLGMMRKDKGLHELLYRSGGVTLHADANWYQIPVDLIAFFPSKQKIEIDPAFAGPIHEIIAGCKYFGRTDEKRAQRALKRAS